MKKSNFLKNSKDLLSRSFNPSKCKTALKLAGARVKLLRNKKEAQVKQMKREIAQLLESGQNQNAKIRVEHVVREEKMMAAYDLIEIYCELTVARMQIIESQKICPVDLKEAIASLLFASPRCGDVPELGDVKKQFTEKYGKDFASAAVELRPQSGVSRLLVEKLAAIAPDFQTKIKILSAIASEHNVKWDPQSFEEKESISTTDFLKGPRTFEETKFPVESPHAEDLGTWAPQRNHGLHHSSSNLSQPYYRSSLGTEKHASAQTSGVNTAFHHEGSGPALHEERAQLFPGDGNATPRDQRRWNMEFKDATAAANAAAESAELASMAARAAAELSNREKFMRQYSNESHKSGCHASEHGGPETYVNQKMAREQFFEEPRNGSFIGNTGSRNNQVDGMQPYNQKVGGRFSENSHGLMKEFTQSTSLNSKASIHDDDSLEPYVPDVCSHSPRKSFPDASRDEMNMQRCSLKSTHFGPVKHDNVVEDRIGKQPNSHSRPGISDDMNVFADYEEQKLRYDTGVDTFLSSQNEGIYGETSHESASLVYDKSESDSDVGDFNTGPKYDNHKPGFHFPASRQRSFDHFSENRDAWSPRTSSVIRKSATSLYPTRKNSSNYSVDFKPADCSKMDDSVSMKLDESGGSSSESDVNINTSRHAWIGDSRHVNPPAKYVPGKSSFDHPAGFEPRNTWMESNHIDKSSPGNGTGLDLRKLTGGLRHKAYNPPPFLENQKDMPSMPMVPGSSKSPELITTYEHNIGDMQNSPFESEKEGSEEEENTSKRSSGQKPTHYMPTAGNESSIKQSLAPSNSLFYSDNTDSDEEAPKESLTRISHRQRSGIFQRTKAPSSSSGKGSYSELHRSADACEFDDQMDQKPKTTTPETPKTYKSWRSSSQLNNCEQSIPSKAASKPVKPTFCKTPEPYSSRQAAPRLGSDSETQQQHQALRKKSSHLGNSEQPSSAKAAESISRKENPFTVQEPKKPWSPSVGEEDLPSGHTKIENVLKPSVTLNKTNSDKQRASHVHPKLPDYDTLVQVLRKNRS